MKHATILIMNINWNGEVRNSKLLIIIAILILPVGVLIIGQILGLIGWCTSYFGAGEGLSCSSAPFLNDFFRNIYGYYGILMVIGIFTWIPLMVIFIPSYLIIKGLRFLRRK